MPRAASGESGDSPSVGIRRQGPYIPFTCLVATKLSVNKYAEQGDEGEEYYEDDGDVEDQALNATPRLEDCACTATAKGTAQSCPTCL